MTPPLSLSVFLTKALFLPLIVLPLYACGGSSESTSVASATAASTTAAPTSTTASTSTSTPATAAAAAKVTVPAAAPASTSTSTTTPAEVTPAPVKTSKSISAWVSCTGTTDDTSGALQAFAAAKNDAFTLVVDCPVRLHSGLAIDRAIFIDNGTTVQFSGAGKFFVDNLFHPAFVLANSSNITLTHWNVEWDGAVPMNPDVGGYELNGAFVTSPGITQPAGAFNDLVLTPWLSSHRGVVFDESQGRVKSIWVGGVNPMAVFFLTGDTSSVTITGLTLSVPAAARGYQFLPMGFSLSANWKSSQTVSGKTPETTQYAAVPHRMTFSGLDLDGILMGWQGNLQDTLFENITAHRYGDLQDAAGGTVGGIGKWFPPPHLFYLNTHAADAGLDNINVHFSNILDEGIRVGVARDKGGSDSVSGYANSLKLGCTDCTVDTYTSRRPDGFMDVLKSNNLVVSNVTASFDSNFINDVFPVGIRFPQPTYTDVTFEHIQMTDTAGSTTRGPIGNATATTNQAITASAFVVTMNKWSGSGLPLPTITGAGNHVALEFNMIAQAEKLDFLAVNSATLMVESSPAEVRVGNSTSIKWATRNAGACTAAGAWSGALAGDGTTIVALASKGNFNFAVQCESSALTSSTQTTVLSQ